MNPQPSIVGAIERPLTPLDTEWWLGRLNALHNLACDTDALPAFRYEPWRKLSAYDISRMANLLAEAEAKS